MKGLHMAVRDIIINPADKSLRRKAENVGKIDKTILKLLEYMTETLQNAGGNGLAAPQIGVPRRLIIVKKEMNYVKLINPVLVRSAGEQISLEGCLSLPGIYGIVRRPEFVVIRALDTEGKRCEIKAVRHLAAAFAHEIDHLDGTLMIDKAVRIVSGGQPAAQIPAQNKNAL